VGTITDGDIRKAFLMHRLAVIPVHEVMNTDFISVMPGELDRARSLFNAKFYLRLLPEVDGDGRLCGVLQRDKVA
jgi:CBS domain-containing protein